jgi:4-hydroxybenzoate polyprenyltransferase
MKTVARSMRLYFWPVLYLNAVAMTAAIRGDVGRGAEFSVAICLLASYGFLLNDLWDRKIDRVNQSRHFENSQPRTLVAGGLTTVACLGLGIGMASHLGPMELRIAWLLAVGLAAYTIVLRRYLLLPTLLASFLAASPLWAPLVLWPAEVRLMHWIFVMAMILLLAGRETLMDVRDRKGDRFVRRNTLPIVFGSRIAAFAAGTLIISGTTLLSFVLLADIVNLGIVARLAAFFVACVVAGLVMAPALRAIKVVRNNSEDRAAIQRFVLQSRTAMAFLPLLIFCLWFK